MACASVYSRKSGKMCARADGLPLIAITLWHFVDEKVNAQAIISQFLYIRWSISRKSIR